VCLPRIVDENENISYGELVSLVLAFTFPEEVFTSGESKYTVSLTYFDNDKDLITIASTEELIDAINLFARQQFVRITTSVKPKKSYSTASSTCTSTAAAAAASIPDSSTVIDSSTEDHGTFTNIGNDDPNPLPPTPPVQVIVESFVGILSNAVQELKGLAIIPVPVPRRTSNNSNNNSYTEENPTQNYIPQCASTKSTNIKAKTGDRNKKELKASKKVAIGALNGNNEVCTESKDMISKEKKEGSEMETMPFIHGRHTCDCCLITPIVGVRYHNTTDHNYDLCVKCYNNYSGNKIKLEPVQLHRDIPFQARWYKRHQRELVFTKRRDRSSRSRGVRGGHHGSLRGRGRRFRGTNANHATSNCFPDSSNLVNNPKPPPRAVRILSQNNQDVSSSTPLADAKSISFDRPGAVATISIDSSEAIQCSLDDTIHKEASIMKSDNGKEETDEEEVVTKDFSECDIVKRRNPEKESNYDANDFISRVVEISKPDKDKGPFCDGLTQLENTSNLLDDQKEVHNTEKVTNKSMDTDSVDSVKLLFEGQKSATIHRSPVAPIVTFVDGKSPTSERKILDISKDESFSSDAIGNGDVAEVIGKTLDMVAGVISEMLSDSIKTNVTAKSKKKTNNEGELEGLKPANVVGYNKETTNDNKIGELIVNSHSNFVMKSGNDDDDDDDVSEWSVVKSACSDGTTESEQVAKAAEMLGSALFNSDIKTSPGENGSDLMRSDSSFSVLTNISTHNSKVTNRWAKELEKLREIGFKNEASCVAVLERLESSDDVGTETTGFIPTNIDRVVNELLELTE